MMNNNNKIILNNNSTTILINKINNNNSNNNKIDNFLHFKVEECKQDDFYKNKYFHNIIHLHVK